MAMGANAEEGLVGIPLTPSFLGSVRWSEENLLAVAAGHVVFIMSPAHLKGALGTVTCKENPVFQIGTVSLGDLESSSLLLPRLSLHAKPEVQAIAWSPVGCASQGGCLLAVSTTDGWVKIYEAPSKGLQAEWVEVADVSGLLYAHHVEHDFEDCRQQLDLYATADAEPLPEEERHCVAARAHFEKHKSLAPLLGPTGRIQKTQKLEMTRALPISEAQPVEHLHGSQKTGSTSQHTTLVNHTCPPLEQLHGQAGEKISPVKLACKEKGLADVRAEETPSQKVTRGRPRGKTRDSSRATNGKAAEVPVSAPIPVAAGPASPSAAVQTVDVRQKSTEPPVAATKQDARSPAGDGNGKGPPAVAPEKNPRTSLSERFFELFVARREKRSANSLPQYKKGQHLRGVDKDLVTQTMQEMKDKHGEEMRADKVSEKELMMLARVLIRHRIVRSAEAHSRPGDEREADGAEQRVADSTPTPAARLPIGDKAPKVGQLAHQIKEEEEVEPRPSDDAATASGEGASVGRPKRNRQRSIQLANNGDVVDKGGASEPQGAESLEKSQPPEKEAGPPHRMATAHRDPRRTASSQGGAEVAEGDASRANGGGRATEIIKAHEGGRKQGTCGTAERPASKRQKKVQLGNEASAGSSITAAAYAARLDVITATSAAWSPACAGREGSKGSAYLATGVKAGRVYVWRLEMPAYSLQRDEGGRAGLVLAGGLAAHEDWVTSLAWGPGRRENKEAPAGQLGCSVLLLATGCSRGSVRLWELSIGASSVQSNGETFASRLLAEVFEPDSSSSLALDLCHDEEGKVQLAAGKASGELAVASLSGQAGVSTSSAASRQQAHDSMVTGVCWAPDGSTLYSCSQDASQKCWRLTQGARLQQALMPDDSRVLPAPAGPLASALPSEIPANSLDAYFGLALSPNGLALVAVRGLLGADLSVMYQRKAHKGALQITWVAGQHSEAPQPDDATAASAAARRDAYLHSWRRRLEEAVRYLSGGSSGPFALWDVLASARLLGRSGSAPGGAAAASPADTWRDSGLRAVVVASEEDVASWSCRRLQLANCLVRTKEGPATGGPGTGAPQQDETTVSGNVLVPSDGLEMREHELRQRLAFAVLSGARSPSGEGHVGGGESPPRGTGKGPGGTESATGRPSVWRWVRWVLKHEGSLRRPLVELAAAISQRGSGLEMVDSEECPLCSAGVSFESAEVATCSQGHKLPRCSVTLRVASSPYVWRCTCCLRRATSPLPLGLIDSSPQPSPADEGVRRRRAFARAPLPCCLFCGILMHRHNPEIVLKAFQV